MLYKTDVYLIGNLQIGKKRNISRPLDGAEQKPSGQLTNVLDSHQVIGRHRLLRRQTSRATTAALSRRSGSATARIPSGRSRIRLGAKQHRYETRQVPARHLTRSDRASLTTASASAHRAVVSDDGRARVTGSGQVGDAATVGAVEVIDGRRAVERHLTVVSEGGDVLKTRWNATLLYGCGRKK